MAQQCSGVGLTTSTANRRIGENMETACSHNLVQDVCMVQHGTDTAGNQSRAMRGENMARAAVQCTGAAMCSLLCPLVAKPSDMIQ